MILSVITCWLCAHCSKTRFEHCTNARGAIAPSAQAKGVNHGRDLSRIRVKESYLEYHDLHNQIDHNAATLYFCTYCYFIYLADARTLLKFWFWATRQRHPLFVTTSQSLLKHPRSSKRQNKQFDPYFSVPFSLVRQGMLVYHSKSRLEHRG